MTRSGSFATSFAGGSARGAASDARDLARNSVFERLARAGFVMAGVVHILVGYIAVRLAFGGGGGTADQSGAMAELASKPGGGVALWIGAVAFAMLALWRLVEAVLGRSADSGETDTKKVVFHRAKSFGEAVLYAVLAFSAVGFARGSGSSGGQRSTTLTARLMENTAGTILLVLVGLAIVGVGGYYVYKGATAKFTKDLDASAGTFARRVGIVGYVAKGLALGAVGALVIVATTRSEPDKASGLDGALKTLGAQPYGQFLLVAAAVGIATYGVYNLIRARHAKM
ncbi:DUF1206 domain-containing protein [Nocardia bovistercoris]|uniref:DUF1206 domain-containing protein n=1 Tax=Nocardia bovistercoris TaxID=2785916 RepID=A0A931IE73_9NOCA|nr:DUF1206 domain-containing protein [Nocardia bovistercoris]MBH0778472.1 DUF1206 domain-containing protein [Nocardia bovistercoris]